MAHRYILLSVDAPICRLGLLIILSKAISLLGLTVIFK
ncbi:putative membrane protein [Ehrlichia cf. muris str. EmCRT]|uniref:Putative membrane protein n=1 Tax=Ehrlichia cf. muris str. EmCRT TaxID=1359167 RepID=A0A0F3NG16_9RICK|nr:putative membrane protein [Ehrlichia cf. muris str. EmCRT]